MRRLTTLNALLCATGKQRLHNEVVKMSRASRMELLKPEFRNPIGATRGLVDAMRSPIFVKISRDRKVGSMSETVELAVFGA